MTIDITLMRMTNDLQFNVNNYKYHITKTHVIREYYL